MPSQIKRVLVEKYNKELTIQKLKNILNNLPKTDNQEGDVDFEEFFTNVEEEGGFVDWEEDPDGTLKCMAFASSKMKEALRTSDPPLIQLDTTFEVEEARYKLMAAVYINPTTNKSEVGFMALMCDETQSSMEFALKSFRKLCLRPVMIFIVDKDFGQISVLNDIFPGSRILLCQFHAIKFIRTLIASAPVVVEKSMKFWINSGKFSILTQKRCLKMRIKT